jgi:folate-binding protein YgfZ
VTSFSMMARDIATMDEPGFVPLEERGVVGIGGTDARSFLQGLISNDLDRLSPERALFAALLTPQGKFLFEMILVERDGRILIDTERDRIPALVQRLMLYRLRAKIEIVDESDTFAVAAILGEGLAEKLRLGATRGACRTLDDGVVLLDPRLLELGARAILPRLRLRAELEGFELNEAPHGAYERRRLELGVPDGGRDMTLERATLLEGGYEELAGVDFKKGCFVGQELTARMKYRGLVRKRLLPVTIEGPAPEPGTIVRLDGRDAGEMRSSADGRGLALLRLEQVAKARAGGAHLEAGGARLEPHLPAWSNVRLD